MVYIDFIEKNNMYHISNKYEIINKSNDDFHIVLYYLYENKCKMIIRRLDLISGWEVNLKVKIYDEKDNYEIISLGTSSNPTKIINIYTTIQLKKELYSNTIIPKIIFQTTSNKDIHNLQLYNSILTYIELNPDYDYKLFDDYEMRLFIKSNFEKNVLTAYDMLIPGAFKADLFRYCYLYINGGCYFDCKSILRMKLNKIINKDDTLILCKDIGLGYYNAVMMSVPNNELLLKVINDCVNNIFNFYKNYNINSHSFGLTDNILSLTGPVLLYNSIHKQINENGFKNVLKLIHKNDVTKFHYYQRLLVEYDNQVFITKNYNGHEHIPNHHYSKLWLNKEIIYLHTYTYYDYKFYQFNYNVKDLFTFHILNKNKIIIERLDDNCGWGNILKIKIIDEKNNKELKIEVGNSNHNYKLIDIHDSFFDNYDNLVKTFINLNKNDKNIYDLIMYKDNDDYKCIVLKINKKEGWKENLKFEVILNDDIFKIIDIESSKDYVKICKINI
jgi:mannosyltransferase OCH1-like enzyme